MTKSRISKARAAREAAIEDEADEEVVDSSGEMVAQMRLLIEEGSSEQAIGFYEHVKDSPLLTAADVKSIIVAMHQAGRQVESIETMVDYLKRFPDDDTKMRLKLAEILITHDDRPMQAMAVLDKIDDSRLNTKLAAYKKKLHAAAFKAQEDGALELDVHDW